MTKVIVYVYLAFWSIDIQINSHISWILLIIQ